MLLIELEGIARGRGGAGGADSRGLPALRRARVPRGAKSAEERDLLWKGRKNAFGAVGRVSPSYYVQDGVVPRTQIAPDAAVTSAKCRAEVRPDDQQHLPRRRRQHAPDHPVRCAQARRSREGAESGRRHPGLLHSVGGSITGEHGVGMEKNELMAQLFTADTLDMIGSFKTLFDPECRLNPGKVLPTGKGCLEIRQPALSAQTGTY